MADLETALNNLHNITGFKPIRFGREYIAVCPCHDDSRPSLEIRWNSQTSKLLINCFVGCSFRQIIQTIDNNIPLPNKATRQYDSTPFWELTIVKTYTYFDTNRKPQYQKVRFDPKGFAMRHWRNGKLKWGMGPNKPILYNLLNVIPAKTVFIVEGEKNVGALTGLDLVGTCNFDGAGPGKWLKSYNRWLFGKTVYIIPDNDEPGYDHALSIHASVTKVARSKIITLPMLSKNQDIYDWLALGYTKSDLLQLL